ncbi:MAG: phosphonate ABC transporter, permease protein PhnE [Hyphomicrobiaceae bacterium]|nr:phosphonate ABC transporter, permease protein PhnE [Hyphomicrobiaceae bacterium]
MTAATSSARGRSAAFPANWSRRLGYVLVALYAVYAASTLDITLDRFIRGLDQGAQFLARMWPPSFDPVQLSLLRQGMIESIQIAVLATFVGVLLSLPLGLVAARNLMPASISWPARGLIALCRSFHPVIVSILFVKAVGFGALAGILALIVASMGFVSKLFAEAIEEMNLKQVEAVRATGASFFGVLVMGVLPQVMARFVGFGAYQLDSNLRNSTMVGIVGGGGIGATLFTAYQRFDYDFVLTILLAIIAVIMVSELASAQLRKIFQ